MWARQRRRWGTHGCPALGVGSTVEPRKYGWAVPSPRGARWGSVTCRQRLGFCFVLHGLHLILLCAAPEAMQKDGNRSLKLSDQVLYQRFPGKIEQQQLKRWSLSVSLENHWRDYSTRPLHHRQETGDGREGWYFEKNNVKIICKRFWLHAANLQEYKHHYIHINTNSGSVFRTTL